MKRTKLLAYVVNFFSMSAVAAGYECQVKLSHVEDLKQVIAEKVLVIDQGQIRSGKMGTLYVESLKKNKSTRLDLNAVLCGWKGEEDLNLVVIRKEVKKDQIKSSQTISEIINIQGESQKTAWLDSYKLDVSCKILS